jgi:hypothetical protein
LDDGHVTKTLAVKMAKDKLPLKLPENGAKMAKPFESFKVLGRDSKRQAVISAGE